MSTNELDPGKYLSREELLKFTTELTQVDPKDAKSILKQLEKDFLMAQAKIGLLRIIFASVLLVTPELPQRGQVVLGEDGTPIGIIQTAPEPSEAAPHNTSYR